MSFAREPQHATGYDRPAQGEQQAAQQTVGPYAAELPGPLLLRFSLEPSSDLLGWGALMAEVEVETGYNHVGLEERVAEGGLDWARVLALIEGLCARCSQANALALAQAVEAMGRLIVPPRAAYLRMVLVEMERIVSHLLNTADTMRALGQRDREAVLRDLRERIVQAVAEWSGARTGPGIIAYGGLTRNADETATRGLTLAVRHVERVLRAQVTAIINSKEIVGRLAGLGTIRGAEAAIAGLRGPTARASGLAVDMRAAFPTGAYEDEGVTIVAQRNGDAFSRLVVRLLECLESARVIEQALDDLPPGPVKARGSLELRMGSGSGAGTGPAVGAISGISRVEGPRGEIFCWVQGTSEGARGLHLSGGSYPSLAVLPGLLRGQPLDDLELLLLSLDLCLPCAER